MSSKVTKGNQTIKKKKRIGRDLMKGMFAKESPRDVAWQQEKKEFLSLLRVQEVKRQEDEIKWKEWDEKETAKIERAQNIANQFSSFLEATLGVLNKIEETSVDVTEKIIIK
jgi:hypothetical protein